VLSIGISFPFWNIPARIPTKIPQEPQFRLTGSNLTNAGTLNLNGAIVTGPASLVNTYGGSINGKGTISTPFINSGGVLSLTGGGLNVTQAFTNTGTIQLSAITASLVGGAITNSGNIQGYGNIGNNITNAGTMEAIGGTLSLSGSVTNAISGLITASPGNKFLANSGLPVNSGVINLTGGTFDNGGKAINNLGQISGYGTFRAGTGSNGLTNNGSVTFTGGSTTVNGDVTNASGKTIKVAYNPATFTGNITNNGIFKTTSATVTFTGSFTNNGLFTSDPATQNFLGDLVIGTNGALQGSVGDIFNVTGNIVNNSTLNSAFDIRAAKLAFTGPGAHQLTWTGADLGSTPTGYTNNFAIGTFVLPTGASLTLLDGNATPGGALYVSSLDLADGVAQISSITGNGLNIYYDSTLADNAYLGDQTYSLSGGGVVAPVPEPSSVLLFAMASVFATGLSRRCFRR